MPCGGECVSKIDPRSKKPKRCRGQASGITKESMQWLFNSTNTETFNRQLRSANRETANAGEGKFSVKNGKVEQEDMKQYLTNQTGKKFKRKSPQSANTLPSQPTRKPVTPTLDKISTLTAKANQATAIADNTSSPEIKSKAKAVADRFKALVDLVQLWEKTRKQRIQQAKQSNAPTIKEIPPGPTQLEPNRPQPKPSFSSQSPTKPGKPKLPPLPGQVDSPNIPAIAKFKNAQPIGKGQYGVVYRDGDKVVKYATQGKIEESEYRIGNKAHALGVAPKIHELGQSGGRSAMVMQAVDGETLISKYKKNGYIDGADIDDGLAVLRKLHARGLSHNDLHIGNMIRDNDGKLQAIDFGRARENDALRIMKEMTRPYFVYKTWYSEDNGLEYRDYEQKGSKLLDKFNAARSEFLATYGTDRKKWPQGQAAKQAIGEFYSKIFG